MVSAIDRLWNNLAAWSDATFGTAIERGPRGPLKHLRKEAREALVEPHDVTEYADCLMLTLDAARRAGFSFDQVVAAAEQKLEVNRTRIWTRPMCDEPSEHVRA